MSKPIQERIYKSRLTITYRTNIDGQAVPQKLPLRILVLGDFSGRGWKSAAAKAGAATKNPATGDRLEDRRVISIKRGTRVEDVMADMGITVPIPSYDHQELCGSARGSFKGVTLKGPSSDDVATLAGSVELSAAPQNGDGGFKGVVDAAWRLPLMSFTLEGTVSTKPVDPYVCRMALVADAASVTAFNALIDNAKVATNALEQATEAAAKADGEKKDADAKKDAADAGADEAAKTAAGVHATKAAKDLIAADEAKGEATTKNEEAQKARDDARLPVKAYGYVELKATGSAEPVLETGSVTGALKLKAEGEKLTFADGTVTFKGKTKAGADIDAAAATLTVKKAIPVNPFVVTPLTLAGAIGGGVTGCIGPVDSEVSGHAEAVQVLSARISPDGATTVTVTGNALAKLAIPITSLESFGPDNVAANIHEIRRLLLLKSLLAELSSYISNRTEMRQALFAALPSTSGDKLKNDLKALYPKLVTTYQPNGDGSAQT